MGISCSHRRQARRINTYHNENDVYTMRFITDIFSRLEKAKYFTVLDCTSGYFQVPLDEKSQQYTAFRCILGLFEFLCMPMGIKGAAERFQRMMETALQGLYGVICKVYQDDLIIYSNTLEDHWAHVNLVLERLINVLTQSMQNRTNKNRVPEPHNRKWKNSSKPKKN